MVGRVLVTHLYDLARRLSQDESAEAMLMRAERLPVGTRTFKIDEGGAQPASFGQDLYQEIFGAASAAGWRRR
jgi:hypothetical protein